MANQKTHEEFIRKLHRINERIIILNTYSGAKNKVRCKCKIDGYEWDAYPSKLLGGQKCPKCKNMIRRTSDEFIKDLYKINPKIDPLDEFTGVMNKIRCKCLIDDYEWETTPARLLRGVGCPKCAINSTAKHKTLTHEAFAERIKEKHPHIIILGLYTKSCNRIKCKCGIDGHEWSPLAGSLSKSGCPVCSGLIVRQGYNDIWTTDPNLGGLLLNKNDGYKYTSSSNKKAYFKCPECGEIYFKKICDIKYRGICCNKCSDGISIPNKFVANILSINGIRFQTEKLFNWSNSKRYDFYLEEINSIIEVNGSQHYTEGFYSLVGRSLTEEQINDKEKYDLAIKNNIDNYIIVDCSSTKLDYMKISIINSMSNIIDIKNTDFNKCYINSLQSILVEACKLTKSGHSRAFVMNKLHISYSTYYSYINTGSLLGLCDYKSNHRRSIVCLESGEIFNSIAEAKRKYGACHIYDCCRGIRNYSGFSELIGKRLSWRYYDDYISES